ncbi:MAG: hypothetical protein VYB32_00130 [Pseudomonadota bacterium]|nr:hypothetical protein [Sphingomonas ginsenosidimutans]MEE2915464.1 hypothetical protein [Pseudomonadota bacterium]
MAVAAGAVGAIAAGMTAALKLGWLDRFFTVMDADPGAEHAAPDLAPAAATPGTARAPEAFRPDPTAPVPDSEREALRPATGPAPTMSPERGEMANQTGAAN